MFKSQLNPSSLGPVEHLYVHVPFCKRFCTYCDFPKVIYDQNEYQRYLKHLDEELKYFASLLKNTTTIYLGGGTPNACSCAELDQLLGTINKYTSKSKLKEYTIECNPSSWNKGHLAIFKKYGINRISLGIQTTNDKLNYQCNRPQSLKSVIEAFLDISNEKSMLISYDFILNLFNQQKKDIEADLNLIKNYLPDHISWYSLMLKPNTPLSIKQKKLPDNEETFSRIVQKKLRMWGFSHYEISSYAKNNNKSIHNMAYWLSKTFLGIGWGAASLLFDKSQKTYFRRRLTGKLDNVMEELIYLSERQFLFQVLLMGLRLRKGINIKVFPYQNAWKTYQNQINFEIEKKNLVLENDYLKCTKHGFDFLDDILLSLMD